MGWTVEQAKSASAITPTPKGQVLTATITITIRDSGMTEVKAHLSGLPTLRQEWQKPLRPPSRVL
jgi:hypothetical protein